MAQHDEGRVASEELAAEGSGDRNNISFQKLAEVAPAGIWRTGPDGSYTYVNQVWSESTGLSRGEWLGHGWSQAIHPDDRERVFDAWLNALAHKKEFRAEWRWLRPDRTTPWALCVGTPELDDEGELVAYVGINIDITRNKELTAQLESARDRAEQGARAKSSFLANMSHEIRTPMNGVIGFTELLLATELTEYQRNHVQLIADSGRTMMALLNDILDVSKIEAGQMSIEHVAVDIHHKINATVRLLEQSARAKHLTLTAGIAEDEPRWVGGDPLRLRQILLNLIGNAIKFTERGAIHVDAEVIDEAGTSHIAITVTDSGIGITPEVQQTIFDPFIQADGSIARNHGGSGLGLAISRQLARLMGGDLTVRSALGFGSRFTLSFPLVEMQKGDVGECQNTEERLLPAIKGKRVLVAEDHEINQRLIMAIAETAGLVPVLARDGAEAIEKVSESIAMGTPFDAILMDVQMPLIDGIEATRRLRATGHNERELPILALTANCFADDVAACREAGMQGHIGKPVRLAELVGQLARVLPRKAETESDDDTPRDVISTADGQRSMSDLNLAYLRQRTDAITAMARAVKDGTQANWEVIESELHKLAGTAAYFGEEQLGEASRRLEHSIRRCKNDEQRLDTLRQHWHEFDIAA